MCVCVCVCVCVYVCVCVVKKIIMSVPDEYSLTSAKSVRVQPANPENCDGVYYWPKIIGFYLVINYFLVVADIRH